MTSPVLLHRRRNNLQSIVTIDGTILTIRRYLSRMTLGAPRLDGASRPYDNPRVAAAELLVLLVIGGACYAALAPLRRAIERRWLRRQARGPGRIIPLVRDGEDVYR